MIWLSILYSGKPEIPQQICLCNNTVAMIFNIKYINTSANTTVDHHFCVSQEMDRYILWTATKRHNQKSQNKFFFFSISIFLATRQILACWIYIVIMRHTVFWMFLCLPHQTVSFVIVIFLFLHLHCVLPLCIAQKWSPVMISSVAPSKDRLTGWGVCMCRNGK